MSTVLRYSVVRFRPFAETGEFANIGVVAVCLSDGAMGYRLAPRRFTRVKSFFEEAAYRAYEDTIAILELEFARLTEFLPHFPEFRGNEAFNHLVRIKESSIIFSEPRVVEFDEDFNQAIDQLFARFIRREAVVQSRETLLTKQIRRALNRAGVKNFHSFRLEDDLVPIVFPLAFHGESLKAIRPLAFSQRAPLAVLDHGSHWRKRFEILLTKGKLRPGNVLIAIEPPASDAETAIFEAYEASSAELRKLPFEVVEAQDWNMVQPEIVEFAREAIRGSRLGWH